MGKDNYRSAARLNVRTSLLFFFFFYLSFLLQPFTNHWTAWEGGGHLFNSSLPLPPALQTLRHQAGDYCRELTSAHRQQPDSNWEPLGQVGQNLSLIVPKNLSLMAFFMLSWFSFLWRKNSNISWEGVQCCLRPDDFILITFFIQFCVKFGKMKKINYFFFLYFVFLSSEITPNILVLKFQVVFGNSFIVLSSPCNILSAQEKKYTLIIIFL